MKISMGQLHTSDCGNGTYMNPIIFGNFADPSIIRDDRDYYMVHGGPGRRSMLMWHSMDLVNWEPLYYVIDDYDGAVWAPELVKHNGKYYIYNYEPGKGTWVITTEDIGEGKWTIPKLIEGVKGIDPGHITDKDNKRYLFMSKNNVYELADDGFEIVSQSRSICEPWPIPDDWDIEGLCNESPKLLHKDGWYYLTTAQGGTIGPPTSHCIVSFRSKSIFGPWESSPYNPISHTWTADEKWWSKGHGTLIDTPEDNWFVVYHAILNGHRYLGRMPLMEPVEWTEDGWFKIADHIKTDLPIPKSKDGVEINRRFELSDDFTSGQLGLQWNLCNMDSRDRISFTAEGLELKAAGTNLHDTLPLLCINQHIKNEVSAELTVEDGAGGGITFYYSAKLSCGIALQDNYLKIYNMGKNWLRNQCNLVRYDRNKVFLKLRNNNGSVSPWYSSDGVHWKKINHCFDITHWNHNVEKGEGWVRPGLFAFGNGKVTFRSFNYEVLPNILRDRNSISGLIKPLFDYPLRDISICKGPDGCFYLTGTDGNPEFKNNDGIRLWKSKDLKNWEYIGKVWDIEKDLSDRNWQKKYKILPGIPDSEKVRGILAPEIHYMKGTYWITYSMNWEGAGLLKSTTGKPEGPYIDIGRITLKGVDASLFQDEDGAVYWVYGGGWIARMKDDMTGLAEKPVLLRPETHNKLGDFPAQVGARGAFLFKMNGKYHLACAEYFGRLEASCYDTFIATADNIYGPYSKRYLAVPHAGHTTFFKDNDNNFYCTLFGDDKYAPFRNRPGIVPLKTDNKTGYIQKADDVIIEKSAYAAIKPVIDVWMRDPQMILAPGGYYYMTGTTGIQKECNDNGQSWKMVGPGIEVFRSKDMKRWENLGLVWKCEETKWTKEIRYHEKTGTYRRAVWAPEIHFINGTFWIVFCMNFGGTGILKSISGKAEGPYESMGQMTDTGIDASLFQDDDGSVYFLWTCAKIAKMKDDMRGFETEPVHIGPAEGFGLGYEGAYMVKMFGKYVLFGSDWSGEDYWEEGWTHGTYELTYAYADNIFGPYSKRHVAAVHGGHCSPFKDKDGNWWMTFFGSDKTAACREKPSVLPLKVELQGNEIIIEPRE